jgi:ATP-binding cassette subfamily F protein 3
MLFLNNLSFGYTDEKLFSKVNITIYPNDKIGLVGRNGNGKTTLLKILADEIKEYDGEKVLSSNISIGFLPQEVNFLQEDFTPFLLCKQAFKDVEAKIKRIEELSSKLNNQINHIEYDNLLNELNKDNLFSYEYKIRMILSNLGLSLNDMNKSFKELSSGYKVRSYLGYLMLLYPDLLMLDEPTNYLDIDAIIYLIDFLKSYEKSFIIVSHDKNLLDLVTNKIWDLFAGNLYVYSNCNYSNFLSRKEEFLINLEKTSKNVEKKIKQQMEFINRFRAKESKASSVQSRIKMVEKIEKVEIPKEYGINFKIKSSNNRFSNILSCENLCFGFNDEYLLEKIHFSILRGDRIFLIGKNGIGKTTFLRLLVGQLKPKEGKVTIHNNSKIGYFEQNAALQKNFNSTVYQFFSDSIDAQKLSETERKKFLGNFGFSGSDVEKNLSFLSGGEKVRLILSKIFLSNPDILILDEPTTHLDIDTKEILIENLNNYDGAILSVSHDIDFIKRVAQKYMTIENKNLSWYEQLSEYFEKLQRKEKEEKLKKKEDTSNITKPAISTNKKQQIEKQIIEYEKEILSIEAKINEIEKRFAANLSFIEIQNLNKEYEELNKRYEDTFAKLIELEDIIK